VYGSLVQLVDESRLDDLGLVHGGGGGGGRRHGRGWLLLLLRLGDAVQELGVSVGLAVGALARRLGRRRARGGGDLHGLAGRRGRHLDGRRADDGDGDGSRSHWVFGVVRQKSGSSMRALSNSGHLCCDNTAPSVSEAHQGQGSTT